MSIARRTPLSYLLPRALRACLFLLTLSIPAVLCQSTAVARLDDTASQVAFTPPACLQGHAVDPDLLPASCTQTWFIVSDDHNQTSHASRSPSARAILQFQGAGVSWFSAPVTQVRGTADVILDDILLDRVQLSPSNTGPSTPTWSTTDLDPQSVHNLTIVPLGDDIISVDSFTLVQSPDPSSNSPVLSIPDIVATSSDHGPAAMKDGSSGAIISLASVASVGLVVLICGGCFFLGRRRKSPGFHMPTVLVDIESALDHPDPPSPTTIRAWRESTHKSFAADAAAGEPTHARYPPIAPSAIRPPSYLSGKDSLFRSDSTSTKSHQDHWQ
ncbi:hypothetical protein JB92DRAFT_3027001 [Gautieria morchelliformis]|nr:hypothetical protein JB92DRAFT_3027001 [Gautieria morchelliformis]